MDESLPQQHVDVVVHVHRRILELGALALGGCDDRGRIEIEQVLDEQVRMLCFDTERRQRRLREVPFVEGDDHAGIAANRSGQHVAIIRVRQGQACDEHFVVGHQAIRNRLIHQCRCTIQLLARQVGTVQ